MSIVVSCAGRFHAYDLAMQFQRFALLKKLITSYPKTEVCKYGLEAGKVHSFPGWEVMSRVISKWTQWTGTSDCFAQAFLNDSFDRLASRAIPVDTSVFIGWSSKSEMGLERARALGAVTILERGSSHIVYQTELLRDEFERYHPNPKVCFTHPSVIDKELREYEIADYISIPSEFVRRSFLAKGIPESKLIKNPYGVNTEQFKPLQKPDNTFRVIYVGQMSLRKGVHYLLQAFHELKLHPAELLLVGSLTKEIKPFFAKYEGSYTYLGVVPQQELIVHYAKANVFVICSIEEGLAMVQVQAMACGLPLICTTNSGGADLMDEGEEGFVLPIRSIEALKEKINWMFENREAAADMGVKARRRVLSGFSWDDYGKRYVQNLQDRHVIKD